MTVRVRARLQYSRRYTVRAKFQDSMNKISSEQHTSQHTWGAANCGGLAFAHDSTPSQHVTAPARANNNHRPLCEGISITGSTTIESSIQTDDLGNQIVVHKRVFQCWDHNCDGRTFSTLSNFRRHCREKTMLIEGVISCPLCGKHFSRARTRDAHFEREVSAMTIIGAV